MINLHERMLPTSAGVEPATSWSSGGQRIQLSHRGRLQKKKKKKKTSNSVFRENRCPPPTNVNFQFFYHCDLENKVNVTKI